MEGQGEAELAQLMNAADAGDEKAYRAFLSRASQLLSAFVRRRVRDGSVDAADIVQETLLAIHLKRHTRRSDVPVTPWLYAIARHKLVDALRRRGRRLETGIDLVSDLAAEPQREEPSDRDIARALDGLASGQRAVVTALSVRGRTVREAAQELGMKESAIRVAFHRGLAAIAAKWGKRI